MIEIRHASNDDMNAVLQLSKSLASTFKIDESVYPAIFRQCLDSESSLLLVAEINGDVVGFCSGYDKQTLFANGRTSWLEEICVSEAHRQSGIGRELMMMFERWCRSRNSKLIALATRRAAPFYKAIGFDDSATYFRKVLA